VAWSSLGRAALLFFCVGSGRMSNAPDRFEAVVLPDGVKKIEFVVDEQYPTWAQFKIEREDHTLGNLLRMQLLRDDNVNFVGYRIPHPLEHHFILRVQSKELEEGKLGPVESFVQAIEDLQSDFALLEERMKKQFEIHASMNVPYHRR